VHELLELADKLDALVSAFEGASYQGELRRLVESAAEVASAWSGSNIGYQSRVYYTNLKTPPPGAHFSSEWGLDDAVGMGTRGEWREYSYSDVKNFIFDRAKRPDLTEAKRVSKELNEQCKDAIELIISSVTIAIKGSPDTYLQSLLDKVKKIYAFDERMFLQHMLPRSVQTRDAIAMHQGLQEAPHQEILAIVGAIRSPADALKSLSGIAKQAGSHLIRLQGTTGKIVMSGSKIFIGHGRSHVWRDLKDFIKDRLEPPYEEFNRVPIAGMTNIARLTEMLNWSALAFIILTAEDEQKDGSVQARMNAIHEAGLFQGRLGFTKAIVLLEEGCAEFSNINGLGQIRFPKGNIAAKFEEIRRVLEREEIIRA
jgi:predicted nucleotide-binding protein